MNIDNQIGGKKNEKYNDGDLRCTVELQCERARPCGRALGR